MGFSNFDSSSLSLPIFENDQAWLGPEIANNTFWVHELTKSEKHELHAEIIKADRSCKDVAQLVADDFNLPELRVTLEYVRKTVLFGAGLFLIRGVPIEDYTIRQAAIAFWAIGVCLGDPVSQNAKGHLLGHVTNVGLKYEDPEVRGYQTSARLPYHTDASDIVGLLCVRSSKSGGLSSVVSSTSIWNELVRESPQRARVLLNDFHRTRWGEVAPGEKPYMSNPIYVPYGDRIFANYTRSAITKAQQLAGIPLLTKDQIDALDCLDALAADPRFHLDMDFRPGDIQLLSNHHIFHSRTTYEDWPDIARRRHLLRLWLACDGGPAVPEVLLRRYGTTPKGRPNGICLPGVKQIAPLSP